jgi:hypothetical protein
VQQNEAETSFKMQLTRNRGDCHDARKEKTLMDDVNMDACTNMFNVSGTLGFGWQRERAFADGDGASRGLTHEEASS